MSNSYIITIFIVLFIVFVTIRIILRIVSLFYPRYPRYPYNLSHPYGASQQYQEYRGSSIFSLITLISIIFITVFYFSFKTRNDEMNILLNKATNIESKYSYFLEEIGNVKGYTATSKYKEFSKDLNDIENMKLNLRQSNFPSSRKDSLLIGYQIKLEKYDKKMNISPIKEILESESDILKKNQEIDENFIIIDEILSGKLNPTDYSQVDSLIKNIKVIKNEIVNKYNQ